VTWGSLCARRERGGANGNLVVGDEGWRDRGTGGDLWARGIVGDTESRKANRL